MGARTMRFPLNGSLELRTEDVWVLGIREWGLVESCEKSGNRSVMKNFTQKQKLRLLSKAEAKLCNGFTEFRVR